MPIIRKVIEVGNSKAVCLPKSWFEYYEKETGQRISQVAIEVNRVLKIEPLLPKEEETSKWHSKRAENSNNRSEKSGDPARPYNACC